MYACWRVCLCVRGTTTPWNDFPILPPLLEPRARWYVWCLGCLMGCDCSGWLAGGRRDILSFVHCQQLHRGKVHGNGTIRARLGKGREGKMRDVVEGGVERGSEIVCCVCKVLLLLFSSPIQGWVRSLASLTALLCCSTERISCRQCGI